MKEINSKPNGQPNNKKIPSSIFKIINSSVLHPGSPTGGNKRSIFSFYSTITTHFLSDLDKPATRAMG